MIFTNNITVDYSIIIKTHLSNKASWDAYLLKVVFEVSATNITIFQV